MTPQQVFDLEEGMKAAERLHPGAATVMLAEALGKEGWEVLQAYWRAQQALAKELEGARPSSDPRQHSRLLEEMRRAVAKRAMPPQQEEWYGTYFPKKP